MARLATAKAFFNLGVTVEKGVLSKIRQYNINPKHILIGKSQTAVNQYHITAVIIQRHVFANLI